MHVRSFEVTGTGTQRKVAVGEVGFLPGQERVLVNQRGLAGVSSQVRASTTPETRPIYHR